MRHAGLRRVRDGAAELFFRHFFVSDALITSVPVTNMYEVFLHHEDEIGHDGCTPRHPRRAP